MKASEKKRKEIVKDIDDKLSDILLESDKWKDLKYITDKADLVGVTPQLTLYKRSDKKNFHDYLFSMPSLLFASKTSPCCFLVSPSLKKDLKSFDKMEIAEYENICEEVFNSPESRGVVLALNWLFNLAETQSNKHFDLAKKNALIATEHFKQGKSSKIGKKLINSLHKDFNLIGFSPNIIYIKVGSKYYDELGVEWCHPFSQPTLTYRHKTLPIVFLVNGNLDFNETRLAKNPENLKDRKLASVITNLSGITG